MFTLISDVSSHVNPHGSVSSFGLRFPIMAFQPLILAFSLWFRLQDVPRTCFSQNVMVMIIHLMVTNGWKALGEVSRNLESERYQRHLKQIFRVRSDSTIP